MIYHAKVSRRYELITDAFMVSCYESEMNDFLWKTEGRISEIGMYNSRIL